MCRFVFLVVTVLSAILFGRGFQASVTPPVRGHSIDYWNLVKGFGPDVQAAFEAVGPFGSQAQAERFVRAYVELSNAMELEKLSNSSYLVSKNEFVTTQKDVRQGGNTTKGQKFQFPWGHNGVMRPQTAARHQWIKASFDRHVALVVDQFMSQFFIPQTAVITPDTEGTLVFSQNAAITITGSDFRQIRLNLTQTYGDWLRRPSPYADPEATFVESNDALNCSGVTDPRLYANVSRILDRGFNNSTITMLQSLGSQNECLTFVLGKYLRKNGAIQAADFNRDVRNAITTHTCTLGPNQFKTCGCTQLCSGVGLTIAGVSFNATAFGSNPNSLACTSSSCFSYSSSDVPAVESYDRLAWSTFDWRRRNADGSQPGNVSFVNSVKDQEACGSCWDFSSVGAFEGQVALAFKLFINTSWVLEGVGDLKRNRYVASDISEQLVLDKAGGGCGGSNQVDANNVLITYGGVPWTKAEYASHGHNHSCTTNPPSRQDPASGSMCSTTGYAGPSSANGDPNGAVMKVITSQVPYSTYLPRSQTFTDFYNADWSPMTQTEIRQHLHDHGPLGVNLWADFGNYGGVGVYDNPSCAKNYSATACNAEGHAKGWCGADLGVDHAVLLVGYGTQLVNTCQVPNITTQALTFEIDFGLLTLPFTVEIPVVNGCLSYGPGVVDYWMIKNSWSWRAWAYYHNDTSGYETGGYIRMRSGKNLCNVEQYLYKPVIVAEDVAFHPECLFPGLFGIEPCGNHQLLEVTPRDVCFNSNNTGVVTFGGNPFTVDFNQADCYSFLCNCDRSLIDQVLTSNVLGDQLGWWDRSDYLGFESLGRTSSDHHSPWKLPNGYCQNHEDQFCQTASTYCAYSNGTSVESGGVDPDSAIQVARLVLGAFFGVPPYSQTAACQLYREQCQPVSPPFFVQWNYGLLRDLYLKPQFTTPFESYLSNVSVTALGLKFGFQTSRPR